MIPFGPIIPVLGSLIPLYMFMKTDLTTSPGKRIALLGSFVGLTGMSLAPLLAMSFALNPMAVPMALGGTGAIFLGATGVSLLAPRGSLLRFGPALGGGALALLGLGQCTFSWRRATPLVASHTHTHTHTHTHVVHSTRLGTWRGTPSSTRVGVMYVSTCAFLK